MMPVLEWCRDVASCHLLCMIWRKTAPQPLCWRRPRMIRRSHPPSDGGCQCCCSHSGGGTVGNAATSAAAVDVNPAAAAATTADFCLAPYWHLPWRKQQLLLSWLDGSATGEYTSSLCRWLTGSERLHNVAALTQAWITSGSVMQSAREGDCASERPARRCCVALCTSA